MYLRMKCLRSCKNFLRLLTEGPYTLTIFMFSSRTKLAARIYERIGPKTYYDYFETRRVDWLKDWNEVVVTAPDGLRIRPGRPFSFFINRKKQRLRHGRHGHGPMRRSPAAVFLGKFVGWWANVMILPSILNKIDIEAPNGEIKYPVTNGKINSLPTIFLHNEKNQFYIRFDTCLKKRLKQDASCRLHVVPPSQCRVL